MKKIEALISPEAIEPVRELMEERHISNFMFSDVIAKSGHGARQHVYRGHAYAVEFDADVKLEAVVRDDEANDTARAILKAAGGLETSCKPRVLLTPVSQVIFQLDEISPEDEPPAVGAKQPVRNPVLAAGRTAGAVQQPHSWRQAFSALARMGRFLTGWAAENRVNEPLPLA